MLSYEEYSFATEMKMLGVNRMMLFNMEQRGNKPFDLLRVYSMCMKMYVLGKKYITVW